MKKLKNILLLGTLFSFFFISCSSSDEDELTKAGPDFAISELQGTWEATSAVFAYSGSGASYDPVRIVADGGTVRLVVQSNGRFTLTIDTVDMDEFIVTGEMFFENNEFFAIRFDDEPNDYEYFGATLTSNTFALNSGPDVAEWDFDGDGNEEPASVSFEFIRK
ncbi:hypothetical protein [Sediminicola sp. 1XM1-17]|uniref:hypothetical protein n=1 Tax=Sediminicola sp. 1XM1-17 TaxID=3127702 RepID=UPI00307798CA